jgi:protein-disulfide isomerase
MIKIIKNIKNSIKSPVRRLLGRPAAALTTAAWRGVCGAVALVVAAGIFSTAAVAQSSAVDSKAIEQAVQKLLRERPELVRDALMALEKKEAAAKARRAKALIGKLGAVIASEQGATVLGNPLGKVTVIEFIDYRCGYCKQMAAVIDEVVKANPDVRVLVKNLPILGPDSLEAARLVLATPPHKRVALHHDLLSQSLDAALLQKLQAELGVSDADKAKSDNAINEIRKLAADLDIQGTPALVVGGEIFYGAIPAEQLNAALAAARMAKQRI